MAMLLSYNPNNWQFAGAFVLILLVSAANAANIFLEWHVAINTTIKPLIVDQEVITINGMFPGPLISATINDTIHVNVFNEMDEPLLFTWNGIQHRLNSWQDGVSGTNCGIQPGKNWSYVISTKDQIGSFFYFPSINFQKAGGAFGPIRVNSPQRSQLPFPKPQAEFDLLVGDWYDSNYKDARSSMTEKNGAYYNPPDRMLLNGQTAFSNPPAKTLLTFNVKRGKTYLLRISNVGIAWSVNFRIQNHKMVLVETEGSYTFQITLDSLDVHVGQSYSVLVTANQDAGDYYFVVDPKMFTFDGVIKPGLSSFGLLHYENSTKPANDSLPRGPNPYDRKFSINQAMSIRLNRTAATMKPNPRRIFDLTKVKLSQTFILRGSMAENIDGAFRYTVNNVSYNTPDTPLKLVEYYANVSGFYELDAFPTNSLNLNPVKGVFVATGIYKRWIELVFKNDLEVMDAWHLDGYGFYVLGFGDGDWTPESRSTYDLMDPIIRSTIQVYPKSWSAVAAYLDNPGMWNLRSQNLRNWYLGQELYLRVGKPNDSVEQPPPENLLLCGKFVSPAPAPASPSPVPASDSSPQRTTWLTLMIIYFNVFCTLHLCV